MEGVLLVAMWLFALTHLDTLVVLVAFCADPEYRSFEVLVGHYAGFAIGLFAAVFAAVLLGVVLQQWAFLLGVVPLGLGIWELLRRSSATESDHLQSAPGAIGRIAVVTAAGIGLSGENIAVFIPFFADLSIVELGAVVGVYLFSAGILFLVALLVGRRTAGAVLPDWIDRWLIPTVLVVVGIYVLLTGLLVV